ncbi:DUF2514 family protein, partial [Pseudomonas sp.]|uniref:DUF2514 family protein n=1 Tax=Pseudomonas sp. TaxID=306 RepID=UPI003FD83327
MTSLYMKAGAILLLIALACCALFSAYHHGETVKDSEWQSKWGDRNTRDEAAALTNETAERDKEQARQHSINKAIEDGQQRIDSATSIAADANARAISLHDAADKLASRLAASEVSGNSCAAAASKTAARAAVVLADVFRRSDQRSGDLAGYADQ